MTYEELCTLISCDEHRTLELKKTTGELKEAMHTACAFLNTEGGWLIFGVAPASLKIIGQQVSDNTQREIAQALSHLEPLYNVHIEYIDVPERNGDIVIAMQFEGWFQGKRPYTYHGCPYIRVESTTKEMQRDMYDERLRQSRPDFFAWERQIAEGLDLSQLDEKLIRGLIHLAVERGRIPDSALSAPMSEVLEKWRLLDKEQPLNVAAVLFSKNLHNYPQLCLRMARFRGTDKNEFIDNQRVEGNFFQLLDAGMSFFRKHLNMSGVIKGLKREDNLEIPAPALREALINALCHRQWERHNLTVDIAIYDDRIEIENPGKFPPSITPESIKQPHNSIPYNPLMAQVLYQTSYLENWGSGVKRILDACLEMDAEEPEWFTQGEFVAVRFYRKTDNSTHFTKDFIKEKGIELTERQEDILRLLREDPTLTSQKISQKISQKNAASPRTIIKDMKVLQELGLLSRTGTRKNGQWEVISPDDVLIEL